MNQAIMISFSDELEKIALSKIKKMWSKLSPKAKALYKKMVKDTTGKIVTSPAEGSYAMRMHAKPLTRKQRRAANIQYDIMRRSGEKLTGFEATTRDTLLRGRKMARKKGEPYLPHVTTLSFADAPRKKSALAKFVGFPKKRHRVVAAHEKGEAAAMERAAKGGSEPAEMAMRAFGARNLNVVGGHYGTLPFKMEYEAAKRFKTEGKHLARMREILRRKRPAGTAADTTILRKLRRGEKVTGRSERKVLDLIEKYKSHPSYFRRIRKEL